MAGGVTNEHPRLRVRTAVAAIVLGLVAVSVSTPYAAASPARTGSEGSGIKWKKCKGKPRDDQLQCATVSVPLDWDRPKGKQIDLAVIRRLASRPNKRIGSMFAIPGGPGQSGYDLVAESGALLDKFGDGRFDVVGWDPRGTNRSSPVECFTNEPAQARFWAGVSIPSTPAESDAYQRKTVELARRCGEVSGELLSHITTTDTARDLDALRQAVGDPALTYVGLSYGTMIGQIYANLFPGRVRAMVLDGLVDAVATVESAEARTVNNVSSADEVFAQLVALCQSAAPGRCALAGHGEPVAQRVTRLFATARRAPIPAPNAQPPGPLSYQDLLNSTFTPLRLPVDWPQLAADLEAAVNGDASNLATQARTLETPDFFAGATTSAAISCGDGPANRPSTAWPEVIPRFNDAGELWGALTGWWLWAPCASNWPAHSTDRYTGPWNATTKTPILLLNNRHDPATSYHNAQVAEQRLGNAVLLTEDGYGHLTVNDPSRCVNQARTRYLVDLITPPRGTVCQADKLPFSQP